MSAVIVGIIILCIAFIFTPIGILLLCVVILLAIIYSVTMAKRQAKQLENIAHVKFIGRAKIYKEGFEQTGFSIGTSGRGRLYFGKRKRLQGTEVTFYVTYSDKDPQLVSTMEGTEQYFKLMSYINQQNTEDIGARIEAGAQSIPKSVEENQQKLTEELVPAKRLKLNPPKLLEIPFEVLPNEFSVEVRHQSCIYKQTEYDGGRYEVDVRCEVHYDSSVKGVTNRRIVISLYDSKDRIFAVRNTWPEHLDKSGCKVAEINFWENIYEEPSKVSISIERCS